MLKELDWIGSSKRDLLEFPMAIRKNMGHALYVAQEGGNIKMLNLLRDLEEPKF